MMARADDAVAEAVCYDGDEYISDDGAEDG